ncbi:hypothetical protein ACIBF5_28395 [Micromonospora sp. NPDC050417]|uniref:hypothetical protein n=1 Tax=Micromonospora sp. NPDC050417 TaxID=3364280 RepID=UPI0037900BAE
MNSTRRKWFLNPDDSAPVDPPATPPAPVPMPPPVVVDRSPRELVTLAVGAATIDGSRRYGARSAMPRRNSGRWSA